MSAITCSHLSFQWPDGATVLTDVTASFPRGRTGLIGRNGSGKSTLLRLLHGQLKPTGGAIHVEGTVAYLPQDITSGHARADQLLGIAETRRALHAIVDGHGSDTDFELVAQDWDIEERAEAMLARLGMHIPDILDRSVASLSGGETMQVALAGALLTDPDIVLLDEPTNNLDRAARDWLTEVLGTWRGTLVVVSHDVDLLDRMDSIAELYEGQLRVFGGNFQAYSDQLAAEQKAAADAATAAAGALRRERKQWEQAQIKLARRARYGKKAQEQKREPKIIMGLRKRQAQVSAGRLRQQMQADAEQARATLDRAQSAVRDDAAIRIDLADTALPSGRSVLALEWPDRQILVRGPERIALIGDNGSGKTSLLRAIVAAHRSPTDDAADNQTIPILAGLTVKPAGLTVGYLPQRLDADDDSALARLATAAPWATAMDLRAILARYLIEDVEVPTSALSGGEQFRIALACMLAARPAPGLLLVDEPTNNLDLDSRDQLIAALTDYRGCLIAASHDMDFLSRLEMDRQWLITGGRIEDSGVFEANDSTDEARA